MAKPTLDFIGKMFGALLVVERAPGERKARWLCFCTCGAILIVEPKQLRERKGGCRNCPVIKHGHGQSKNRQPSPTYRSWSAMLNRCYNKRTPMYAYYGAKGVRVFDAWHKFPAFLADMGERPDGMTIDRFPDKSGNYEPGNCRWATRLEQAINRSMVKLDEDKVREIRRMHGSGKGPAEIARLLEIDVGLVGDVTRRRSWRHVKP